MQQKIRQLEIELKAINEKLSNLSFFHADDESTRLALANVRVRLLEDKYYLLVDLKNALKRLYFK